MEEIRAIGEKYGIPVIEDAAESLGAHISGKKTGSFGKVGILSFNGNKIITTSGGGAMVSDDEKIIQKARFLSTQARDDAPHYQHSEIGYNYRMSNIVAGIGRGQMMVLEDRIHQRRDNFNRYKDYFIKWNDSGFSIEFQEEPEGYFSNRWLSAIVVDPSINHGLTREEIRLKLQEENIESRPLWKPMHLQPVFESFPYYGNGVSDQLFEHGLCLPSGSNLTNNDFERIFGALDHIFKKSIEKVV
jgi:dTDP-4-amino-4,6-dideoxygalactose transaminase